MGTLPRLVGNHAENSSLIANADMSISAMEGEMYLTPNQARYIFLCHMVVIVGGLYIIL